MRPTNASISESKVQELCDSKALLLDPDYLDEAIIDTRDGKAVYSYDKIVIAFCEREGWTHEESIEWVEYNTIRACQYMKDGPIIE